MKHPPFCERKGAQIILNLHPGQTEAMEALERFVFMFASTQGGKALDVETPIPTPYGFKRMGDLALGDKVFDEVGRVCTITFVTPVLHGRACYRVEFDDGSVLVADAEHLWATQTAKQRASRLEASIVTTEDIRSGLQDYRGAANHSIVMPKPVQYPERVLPVPPYTLGVWLGDGLSRGARVFSADPEVLESIRGEGVLVGVGRTMNEGNKSLAYTIGRTTKGGNDNRNPILDALRGLGVINNKHIPELYLIASVAQRTALLCGLMDTDGCCEADGRCEFSNMNERLAIGTWELLASLGIKARLKTKTARLNGKACGTAYRVMFTTNAPVFQLPRKLSRQGGGHRGDRKNRYIWAVAPVPSRPVKCIQVDGPSRLYLAGRSCIPTHNTCLGPWWLKQEIDARGPGDYLAVTATFPLLNLKMLPEFLYVFDHLLKLGTYRSSDKVFEFTYNKQWQDKWPGREDVKTRVIFASAANSESIESATALAAWLDEVGQLQFHRASWEAILRRLSLAQGRVLGTTTLYGLGWMKTEIYDKWKAGASDITVIQFDSLMNPAFPVEEYERARRSLPAWKFNLFYRGMYDKPAGLIYDCFDEVACCIPRAWSKPPDHYLCYVGHDFGPNNTGAVWYAQDPGTGWLYVYRNYLAGGLSSAGHAAEFKRLSEGENIVRRVGGAQTNEDGYRDAYTAAGWPISKPTLKGVEAGIDRVYSWHKNNRIFVFDDVGLYLHEKETYSRKLDENYETTQEIDSKANFHLMDAERYILGEFAPEAVEGRLITKVYSPCTGHEAERRGHYVRHR
tara:strand:+ start:331 stop:2715 length:2385 start_codon:yes stop_codon:yes gene_type:complete